LVDELQPCAVELAEYSQYRKAMEGMAALPVDVHAYIMLLLRHERLVKCRSLDPEIIYQDRFQYHETRLMSRLAKQLAALASLAEGKKS
jgi:hypothetical protein